MNDDGLPSRRNRPMSLLYNVRVHERIVHVELGESFVIALRQMLPLWSEILAVCREHACDRVLVVGHRPRRDMDYDGVSKHGDFLQGLERPGIRVAFCLREYTLDELTARFRAVANTGNSRVEFFDDLDAALAWLKH